MITYKGYLGRVEYDEQARILHGEVLGIRDVITFQADKASDIEAAFRESVDDYLAYCRTRGEEPDKPFSGQFMVRVDKALHRKLAMIAQATGQSLNAVITQSLEREAEQTLPKLKNATGGTSCVNRASGRVPRLRAITNKQTA
jgi:predicted HicB family RNase H-like nuclease